LPSGLPDWLQSLPVTEPANYRDTKARVKEKAVSLPAYGFGAGRPPLGGESSAVFLDPQGTRRYDSPGHVSDRSWQGKARGSPAVQTLASYHRCLDRIRSAWPSFLAKRGERLKQQERHGVAAEKVAKNILEDLLTTVLDWSVGDLNTKSSTPISY